MRTKIIFGAFIVLLSNQANAWVDGTYICNASEITISSVSITASQSTPFLVSKFKGKTEIQGFAVVRELAGDNEELSLSVGPGARQFFFKNGELFLAGNRCSLK